MNSKNYPHLSGVIAIAEKFIKSGEYRHLCSALHNAAKDMGVHITDSDEYLMPLMKHIAETINYSGTVEIYLNQQRKIRGERRESLNKQSEKAKLFRIELLRELNELFRGEE